MLDLLSGVVCLWLSCGQVTGAAGSDAIVCQPSECARHSCASFYLQLLDKDSGLSPIRPHWTSARVKGISTFESALQL